MAAAAGSRSTSAGAERVDPQFDRMEKWAFKLKASFPRLAGKVVNPSDTSGDIEPLPEPHHFTP